MLLLSSYDLHACLFSMCYGYIHKRAFNWMSPGDIRNIHLEKDFLTDIVREEEGVSTEGGIKHRLVK